MTFNENVKQDTLNFNNIKLTKKGTTDQNVTGLTLTKTANSFTLKPIQDLDIDTKYELSVKDIEDLNGNKMGERVVKFGRIKPPEITEFSYTAQNVIIKFSKDIQIPTKANFVFKQGDNVEFAIDTNNNPTIKLTGSFSGKYKLTIKDIKDLENITMQETQKTFKILTRDVSEKVVIDTATGLKWKDDANVSNSSAKKTWQEAVEYCEKLGNWRLPEIWELNGLVDLDKGKTFDVFTNVANEYYWSNTTHTRMENMAFYFKYTTSDSYYSFKSKTYYVRCVQGPKQEQAQSCTRDNETKIVTCTDTNLEWQDDEDVKSNTEKTWQGAVDYCENLTLNGNGWRLPNINELLSIVDYEKSGYAINSAFTNNGYYWSSSFINDITVKFIDFASASYGTSVIGTGTQSPVRCVRTAN